MTVSRPIVGARASALATGLWQVVGLVAANHVWTRLLTGPEASGGGGASAGIGAGLAVWTLALAAVEELAFRGALFGWLRSRAGFPAAALGSALLFAALHAPPTQAGIAFLLGLQLAALREARGLGLAIAAHGASNLAALAIVAFPDVAIFEGPSVFGVALLTAGSALAALAQEVRSARP
ncbi:MAG: CPBP family intramembrane metalloprotease [bacterium]|nr:CPBP family intramembrane metalloprotease [bacterium]